MAVRRTNTSPTSPTNPREASIRPISTSYVVPPNPPLQLSREDAWITGQLNLDEFKSEIVDLGKKLLAQQGPADLAHLHKIIRWSRFCQYVGALTMWYAVNPVSIFLLSLGTMSRWAIIGHHVCHGGFDKCSEGRYNRFKFGVGSLWRRAVDWLDWVSLTWSLVGVVMH